MYVTGNVLAKNSKFSNEMKPAPLQKTVHENKLQEINFQQKEEKKNLKSVDGSFPCHPICFH